MQHSLAAVRMGIDGWAVLTLRCVAPRGWVKEPLGLRAENARLCRLGHQGVVCSGA